MPYGRTPPDGGINWGLLAALLFCALVWAGIYIALHGVCS